jgi:hypothetical protein
MAQLSGQRFESSGGMTVAANDEIGFVSLLRATTPPAASEVMGSVERTLIPASTPTVVVNSAKANVTASMPSAATLAGAAELRAASGDTSSLVVDFQGQRTVSELIAPSDVTITNLHAWLGTSFDTTKDVDGFTVQGGNDVTFTELQTERLLVKVDGAASVDSFAQNGSVVLPTPPSDLELLVNGTRAWFAPGPISTAQFAANDIDLTNAVAAAAATGQDVVLTFRAAAPAALTLSATAEVLQRYPVVFPEGPTRTVDAPSEGAYPLALPVDQKQGPGRGQWFVRGVVLNVSAKLPPTRVQPADGPDLTDAVELTLDPDHTLIVQLPRSITASLASLTGVRIPVVVGPDGGELAGTLRSNVPPKVAGGENSPGDPIPKAALGPVTLPPPAASAAEAVTWIDLALTAPHPLASGEIVWLEVQAARGTITWKMALRPGDDGSVAQLRRRASSGLYVHLSPFADEYAGAVRVVGQERPNEPLAAVEAAVAGAEANGSVAGVPTQAGTTLVLALNPAVAFPTAPNGDASQFPLELTIATPGAYAVTAAELQYTTSGGST